MERQTTKAPPAFAWRGWAVADVLYGLAIAVLFARWVPWRTPVCNVLALSYGLAHVGMVPFLVRGHRLAWRGAFALSLLGVFLGILSLAGLLFSWAYLRASFGAFGAGASVVCLLLAVVVANACGLYPALRLAALGRARAHHEGSLADRHEEVEARPAAGGLGLVLFLLLGLPAMGLGAAALDITLRTPVKPRAPWPKSEAAHLLGALARVDGLGACQSGTADQARTTERADEDWRLSALSAGVAVWSSRERGAFGDLCVSLRRQRERQGDMAPFWLLERVSDRRLLPGQASPWLTLGLVPGLDGAEGRDSHVGFSALDAVAEARFGVAPILPQLEEVRLGLDGAWAAARLPPPERWMRVRYETWLWSTERAEAWPVEGGRAVRASSLTRAELTEAAHRAAQYLLRVQIPDGRYRYRVDMRTASAADPFDDGGYDLPRHAGTTAALGVWAEKRGGHPEGPALAAAAVRGADWMLAQRPAGGFLSWGPEEARLGENALALVALLAAARASAEARARLEAEARALASKLEALVQPDGTVTYRFDPATRAAHPAARPMFEAEEAAYALILSARQLGAPAFGTTARRILEELVHRKDRYFLGWFVYGADAWTCLAVEAGWPEYTPPGGLEHCRGYASFLRRMQDDGRGPFPDRLGQYGFSEILVPQTPAAAGFSEAVLATWALARRLGVEDEALAEQGRRGLLALLREQTRAETAFFAREAAFVDGGFTRSSVEPEIRVDFVQHALSALMWGASLVGEPPGV